MGAGPWERECSGRTTWGAALPPTLRAVSACLLSLERPTVAGARLLPGHISLSRCGPGGRCREAAE